MRKGKCKEAFLLACKLVGNLDRILGLRNAKITTEVQRLKTTCNHEELFFEDALKATRALSQLRRETEEKTKDSARALSPLRRELEQPTKQCVDLANGIKTAADQLSMLVSDTASKPVAVR